MLCHDFEGSGYRRGLLTNYRLLARAGLDMGLRGSWSRRCPLILTRAWEKGGSYKPGQTYAMVECSSLVGSTFCTCSTVFVRREIQGTKHTLHYHNSRALGAASATHSGLGGLQLLFLGILSSPVPERFFIKERRCLGARMSEASAPGTGAKASLPNHSI